MRARPAKRKGTCHRLRGVVLHGLLVLGLLGLAPFSGQAQTLFPPSSAQDPVAGTMFGDTPDLFPRNGKIKLLVIALNPFNLTESAAEQISLILQKSLRNSGHFAVVGSREANAAFEKEHQDLVDCREIACGVESGKRLGAEWVLVGNLTMENETFILAIRLIDAHNNTTDYAEKLRFTDESMEEDLFQLANNISRNSLLSGRVLSTSTRGIVIDLGKRHGLKIGDVLIVYKQEVPISSLAGEKLDIQRKKIAIVKILTVHQKTSQAIISHSTEEPQVGYFVQTYLDPSRQIRLAENSRREIDTGIRLEKQIRPLTLAPVVLTDTEKRNWSARLRYVENNRQLWLYGMVAGAVATTALIGDFSRSSTDKLRAAIALGATGYAYLGYRGWGEKIEALNKEGEQKGFLSNLDYRLRLSPHQLTLHVAYRF